MPAKFPAEFEDLEQFADWAAPTELERVSRRNAYALDELMPFYAATLPRIPAMVAFLNQYPVGEVPAGPPQDLYSLLLACIDVSHPIELKWPATSNPIAFPVERLIF